MIVPPTISRFVGQIFFTKNEISVLGKVRIVKKNLVHVHGFPSSLANMEKLKKYFCHLKQIQKQIKRRFQSI